MIRITAGGQPALHQVQNPLSCAGGRVVHTPSRQPVHPGAPRRTIVVQCDRDSLMALRRSIDPNLPPSYDQAVSGQDRSVKVEDGMGMSDLPPPVYTSHPTAPSLPVVSEERPRYPGNEDDEPLLP